MSPKTYSSWCFVSRGFVRYSSGGRLCHNLLVATIFRNSHFPACTAVDMQHFTAVLPPYSLHAVFERSLDAQRDLVSARRTPSVQRIAG